MMNTNMIEKDKYKEIMTCRGNRFMKWGYQHKNFNIYYFRYEGLEERPTILASRGILRCDYEKNNHTFYGKLIPVVFQISFGVYSFAILTREHEEYGRLPVFVDEEFFNEWIDDAFDIDVIGIEEYLAIESEASYFSKKIEEIKENY